jgi:hypothetical protein
MHRSCRAAARMLTVWPWPREHPDLPRSARTGVATANVDILGRSEAYGILPR